MWKKVWNFQKTGNSVSKYVLSICWCSRVSRINLIVPIQKLQVLYFGIKRPVWLMSFTSLSPDQQLCLFKIQKMQLFGGWTVQTYKKILQFRKLLLTIAEKLILNIKVEMWYTSIYFGFNEQFITLHFVSFKDFTKIRRI